MNLLLQIKSGTLLLAGIFLLDQVDTDHCRKSIEWHVGEQRRG